MLLGEAIQRVQSLYSKGVQSDDTRLTSRHIYSALLSARSTLINQQSNKSQKVSQWSYQPLPCVELIKAPLHECACIPSEGCMILRSKYKLPEFLANLDNHLIEYVTSMDGNIRFDESKFETNKYLSGNKYTGKKPDFYIRNGYLYVTILTQLKAITVSGLFHDIIAAYRFPSLCEDCVECQCRDIMEYEFPIDGRLTTALVEIANRELIVLMKQMEEDKHNNASDESDTAGVMVHQPQP